MASAKDIRDILSIPHPAPGKSKRSSTSSRPPNRKRPVVRGLTRELYNLIGDNAPPLVATQEVVHKPKFKGRPEDKGGDGSKWGKGLWGKDRKVTPWKWEMFVNDAREDGMKLGHWVKNKKGGEADDGSYAFAKFNVQADVYTYTDKEYLNYLRDEEWTKAETDYLFDLVMEYQIRWPIIYDRYDYSPPSTSTHEMTATPRTMEDLKARYYSVCRKLIRARRGTIPEEEYNTLLASYTFDKSREVLRKQYIQSLLSRSASQVKQESQLFLESRRITQNFSRIRAERDQLLSLLSGANGGVGVSMIGKRKEKEDKKTKLSTADAKNCVSRDPTVQPSPAHLRSARPGPTTDALKPEVSKPLMEILTSLRVPQRLIMPTKGNMDRLEALWVMGKNMVELKRAIVKSENQLKVLKGREAVEGFGQSQQTPSVQAGVKRGRSESEAAGEGEDGAVSGRRIKRNVG